MKEVRVTINLAMDILFMADEDWSEERCIRYVMDNKEHFAINKELRNNAYAEFTGYEER